MQTVCYTKTCESVAEDHKFSIQPCSAHLAKHASVCLLCTHWLQQNGTVVCLSFLRDLINFICLFAGPHFESLNVFIHSTMHPVMAAYLIRSWFALRENKLSSPFLWRDVVITGKKKKSRFSFFFSAVWTETQATTKAKLRSPKALTIHQRRKYLSNQSGFVSCAAKNSVTGQHTHMK